MLLPRCCAAATLLFCCNTGAVFSEGLRALGCSNTAKLAAAARCTEDCLPAVKQCANCLVLPRFATVKLLLPGPTPGLDPRTVISVGGFLQPVRLRDVAALVSPYAEPGPQHGSGSGSSSASNKRSFQYTFAKVSQ
jgi:hypothetical protein